MGEARGLMQDSRRTQVKVGLHVLGHQLDAGQAIVDDTIPSLELKASIGAIGKEQRVLAVLLDGLAVKLLGLVIFAVLEVQVPLGLELVGGIFVARWRHGDSVSEVPAGLGGVQARGVASAFP